jgi:hypothetical protein
VNLHPQDHRTAWFLPGASRSSCLILWELVCWKTSRQTCSRRSTWTLRP